MGDGERVGVGGGGLCSAVNVLLKSQEISASILPSKTIISFVFNLSL